VWKSCGPKSSDKVGGCGSRPLALLAGTGA
jgi:hypothetical protein